MQLFVFLVHIFNDVGLGPMLANNDPLIHIWYVLFTICLMPSDAMQQVIFYIVNFEHVARHHLTIIIQETRSGGK